MSNSKELWLGQKQVSDREHAEKQLNSYDMPGKIDQRSNKSPIGTISRTIVR